MTWLPGWRGKKRDAVEDREAAERALKESQARGPKVARLAGDLEDLRRRNHLAPKIAAAFQYSRPNGGVT